MGKPSPAFVLVEEAAFTEFEWDEAKRETNWNVHEVDFEDVKGIFRRPHVVASSHGYGESRWAAVVFTMREERCRVISARRARHHERSAYHEAIRTRSKTGKN